jgi:hypothetical protein
MSHPLSRILSPRLGATAYVDEKIFGKVFWRKRKVAEVLESLGANDATVVSELSRLGRGMLECMEILSVAAQSVSPFQHSRLKKGKNILRNPRKASIRTTGSRKQEIHGFQEQRRSYLRRATSRACSLFLRNVFPRGPGDRDG